MASKRMTRALRSSVRQNIRRGRERKIGKELGLTDSSGGYIYAKAQTYGGSQGKKNTRSYLWTYSGDDRNIKKAQRCFKNNIMKGQDSEGAYTSCGLGYGTGSSGFKRAQNMPGTQYGRSRSSNHKRAGIVDELGQYKGNNSAGYYGYDRTWVDKRS